MKIDTLHRNVAVYFQRKVGKGGNGERGEQKALQPIFCWVLSFHDMARPQIIYILYSDLGSNTSGGWID